MSRKKSYCADYLLTFQVITHISCSKSFLLSFLSSSVLSVIILMDTKNKIEEYSVTVADKMWQTSQSNHSKGLNLEKDLDNLMFAMEDNGWNKDPKGVRR